LAHGTRKAITETRSKQHRQSLKNVVDEIDVNERVGRGLTKIEVAVIKRLKARGIPRDEILTFFTWPGRRTNPAAIGEIDNGKIGRYIPPASDIETDDFVRNRIEQAAFFSRSYNSSPVAPLVVSEVIRLLRRTQGNLLSDESEIVEYKSEFSADKENLALYIKTLSAFSNNSGGYLLFGVSDKKTILGIPDEIFYKTNWDQFSQMVTLHFQPTIRFDKAIVDIESKKVGVIYAYRSKMKPVMCTRSFQKVFSDSDVFYRYWGRTEKIKHGDFMAILQERDDQNIRRIMETTREIMSESQVLREGILNREASSF
jgi:predicted HTH transcriptional regulator